MIRKQKFQYCPLLTQDDIIHSMFNIESNANGTPQSILLWANNAFPGNKKQQRAFEILTAKFILVFCSEAHGMLNISYNYTTLIEQKYSHYIQLLREMVGEPAQTNQLIMLLNGAAGSGKQKIINELIKYAKLFCENIKQPFTSNTILVTGYYPTTLVSIGGKPINSILFQCIADQQLWRKNVLKFINTVKMLIIFDVQLISASDIKTIDRRLQLLRHETTCVFGGIDLIFVGDFCQLPPIGKKTNIFDTMSSIYIFNQLLYKFTVSLSQPKRYVTLQHL